MELVLCSSDIIVLTFSLTVFAWVFFRAANVSEAFHYISKIFSNSIFTIPEIRPSKVIALIALFMIIEWIGRERHYAISHIGTKTAKPFRWLFYYSIIFAIFYFAGKEQQFIYFQF